MPDGGGIFATETICRALPSTKIVLITATPDEEGAIAAASAGADGYLDKAWTLAGCRRSSRRSPTVRLPTYPRRLMYGLLRAVRQANLSA
jgi:CheY-like chemotaxis protein